MDIIVPAVGESVVEALVAKWEKKSGETVTRDDIICELETDKITLPLNAEVSGRLTIVVEAGETVKIGTIIGRIEAMEEISGTISSDKSPEPLPPTSPSVRKLAADRGIELTAVNGTGRGGRILAADLENRRAGTQPATAVIDKDHEEPLLVHSEEPPVYRIPEQPTADSRSRRVAMTPIRKRIAERLLAARLQTAMLTTFNEADMSRIIELRQKFGEHYLQKFGSKPGLMPFFVKACCEALREFPEVNASIDGNDIVYHDYYDIGIAIGAEKGLVVPVLRDADRLHFREIDSRIADYTVKIKENRLVIRDLEGGTFTISNGGVYGSLLSTPILNPPQSAVLGMHTIQERAVVRNSEIVIRPMMNLALSYDHRLIDGKEAVQFLKRVKELLEEPEELLLEG